MHSAAGNGIEIEASERDDAYGAVVSDLVSLIEHVRASLKLIEQAAAQETSPGHEASANIIVLDDITPRYLKAAAAIKACDANLGLALHSLHDSRTSRRGTSEVAARQPALSIVRG